MISREFANTLRESDPKLLVKNYSKYTSDVFMESGVPVVIAARNEENDLPATLISLAGSTREIWPVVVENGSTDRTFEVATKMGAHVLRCSQPFKMAALQTGICELDERSRLGQPVLFTDADSMVGPTWAEALHDAVKGSELKCASGRSIVACGPSELADFLGTLAMDGQDIKRILFNEHPVGRGDDSAINFAGDKQAVLTYLSIRPNLFIGEDDMIFDLLEKRHDAKFAKVLGNRAAVLSRGDRFKKPSDRILCVFPGWKKHLVGLYSDYDSIDPAIYGDKISK